MHFVLIDFVSSHYMCACVISIIFADIQIIKNGCNFNPPRNSTLAWQRRAGVLFYFEQGFLLANYSDCDQIYRDQGRQCIRVGHVNGVGFIEAPVYRRYPCIYRYIIQDTPDFALAPVGKCNSSVSVKLRCDCFYECFEEALLLYREWLHSRGWPPTHRVWEALIQHHRAGIGKAAPAPAPAATAIVRPHRLGQLHTHTIIPANEDGCMSVCMYLLCFQIDFHILYCNLFFTHFHKSRTCFVFYCM